MINVMKLSSSAMWVVPMLPRDDIACGAWSITCGEHQLRCANSRGCSVIPNESTVCYSARDNFAAWPLRLW